MAIALILWIPDSTATGTSGSTVHAGVLTFLTAQHGGIRLSGVDVGFVPLGLTLLAVALCRRSARVLWFLPVVRRDLGPARVARLTGVQILAYAVTCAALLPFSVVGTSRAPGLGVVLGAIGVGAAGFGSAALAMTPAGPILWQRLPATARAATRAGSAAAAVYLAGGALLAAAATALKAGRFVDLSHGLGTGVAGVAVAALNTLAAPNAAVASTSLLAGPGFAVGYNSTYSLLSSHPGPVPAFPVLAGLPSGAATPVQVLVLAALTVLAAGGCAGRLAHRGTRAAGWLAMLRAAVSGAVISGVLLAAAAALAGGRMGAHQLSAVGASPWHIGAAATVEVACVAVVTGALARLLARRERRDAGSSAQGRLDQITNQRTVDPRPAEGATADDALEQAPSVAEMQTVELPLVAHSDPSVAAAAVDDVPGDRAGAEVDAHEVPAAGADRPPESDATEPERQAAAS